MSNSGTSRKWKLLLRQVEALRQQFLPKSFDPLGQYDNYPQTQAHTRAFVVLAHAEVETYLETWAKDIARAAEHAWQTRARITKPLAFLLGSLGERLKIPAALGVPRALDSEQGMVEIAVRLFQKYYKRVNDNHGIKEINVLGLFSPLGVPGSALGSTLLPNLDSYGDVRGEHAHWSAKAVTNILDPETEYVRVCRIVADLADFDRWLVSYRRSIR